MGARNPSERNRLRLKHDPEKWIPVFGKIMLKQKYLTAAHSVGSPSSFSDTSAGGAQTSL